MKSAYEAAMVFLEDRRVRLYVLLDQLEIHPELYPLTLELLRAELHELEAGCAYIHPSSGVTK
jgi:hypothetical protein